MLALELVPGRAQRDLTEGPARGVHRAVAGRGDRAGAGGGRALRMAFGPLRRALRLGHRRSRQPTRRGGPGLGLIGTARRASKAARMILRSRGNLRRDDGRGT